MITPDHVLKYPILCYPVGAGGNWLRRVLLDEPLPLGVQNFHRDINGDIGPCTAFNNKIPGIIPTHNPDQNWQWVLSSEHRFNFYLNRLYKTEHCEFKIFDHDDQATWQMTCLNIANRVCAFDSPTTFFDFEKLITQPDQFLSQVNWAKIEIGKDELTIKQFLPKQLAFINTCVDTRDIYENWDNMFWVLFIVAQLDHLGLARPSLGPEIKKFAQDNYHRCRYTKTLHLDTRVTMPEWII